MNTFFFRRLSASLSSSLKSACLAVGAAITLVVAAPAQALQVTVTIPPLAGMIAPLLDSDDRIDVLLKPGVSPHGFQLKPSHLDVLQRSDLLISAGTPVDAWVDKFAGRVQAKQLRLADLQGIEKRALRQGGIWEKKIPKTMQTTHEHDAHDHDHGHDKLSFDGHLWMSMHNAELLVQATAQMLIELKPQKRAQIEQAQQQWLARLAQQDQQNRKALTPYQDKAFLVLHDAFQYFERHYGLNGVGSVRLNPEVPPSLKRLNELRNRLIDDKVQCIFQEPQFPSKQLERLAAGTSAKIGLLDPMGTRYIKQSANPEAAFMPYDQFTAKLTESFVSCLEQHHD